MKRVLFLMLTLAALVSCESEYDKMSEYEKAIYDVGTNSKLPIEDVLKNTEFWVESKVILSTLPDGKGDVTTINFDGDIKPTGVIQYGFIFKDKFRYYTSYITGLEYLGFYADYDYVISEGNIISIDNGPNLNEYAVFGMAFDKMRIVAYSEECVMIEICNNKDKMKPYTTFILKAGSQTRKDKLEKYCTDVETFEKIFENM